MLVRTSNKRHSRPFALSMQRPDATVRFAIIDFSIDPGQSTDMHWVETGGSWSEQRQSNGGGMV